MFNATVTWNNANPDTIWGRLAVKLGREPTHLEAREEVRRILAASFYARAEAGKLPHQRKRRA